MTKAITITYYMYIFIISLVILEVNKNIIFTGRKLLKLVFTKNSRNLKI